MTYLIIIKTRKKTIMERSILESKFPKYKDQHNLNNFRQKKKRKLCNKKKFYPKININEITDNKTF